LENYGTRYSKKNVIIAIASFVILISLFFYGCAHQYTVKENEKDYFYNYNKLSSELEGLRKHFPNIMSVRTIGEHMGTSLAMGLKNHQYSR